MSSSHTIKADSFKVSTDGQTNDLEISKGSESILKGSWKVDGSLKVDKITVQSLNSFNGGENQSITLPSKSGVVALVSDVDGILDSIEILDIAVGDIKDDIDAIKDPESGYVRRTEVEFIINSSIPNVDDFLQKSGGTIRGNLAVNGTGLFNELYVSHPALGASNSLVPTTMWVNATIASALADAGGDIFLPDDYLRKDGDTLTGAITLPSDGPGILFPKNSRVCVDGTNLFPIDVNHNGLLTISGEHFNLYDSRGNYVSFYGGPSNSGGLALTFCGDNPEQSYEFRYTGYNEVVATLSDLEDYVKKTDSSSGGGSSTAPSSPHGLLPKNATTTTISSIAQDGGGYRCPAFSVAQVDCYLSVWTSLKNTNSTDAIVSLTVSVDAGDGDGDVVAAVDGCRGYGDVASAFIPMSQGQFVYMIATSTDDIELNYKMIPLKG